MRPDNDKGGRTPINRADLVDGKKIRVVEMFHLSITTPQVKNILNVHLLLSIGLRLSVEEIGKVLVFLRRVSTSTLVDRHWLVEGTHYCPIKFLHLLFSEAFNN